MYRRKQVEEMTGIPARRIHFYTDQGLLPAVEKSTGRGIERQYSKDDVFRLAIVREMSEAGLQLATIKIFLEEDQKMKATYRAMGCKYFDRIAYQPFSVGQRAFFVYERRIDESQTFAILTPSELHDRLSMQYGSDSNYATSQVIINLALIFEKIEWL